MHSQVFGIRRWNSQTGRFEYWSQSWTKRQGHQLVWADNSDRAQTTTSLLSAMFEAQRLAKQLKWKWGVEVVSFDEPVLWSSHHTNRPLELGLHPKSQGAALTWNVHIAIERFREIIEDVELAEAVEAQLTAEEEERKKVAAEAKRAAKWKRAK